MSISILKQHNDEKSISNSKNETNTYTKYTAFPPHSTCPHPFWSFDIRLHTNTATSKLFRHIHFIMAFLFE